MEPQTSSITLCNVTVIDHAYIDNEGMVVGGSFHASWIVTGSLDPVEKVVVDFSTIKKELKGWIDSNDCGFDHKLWIIEGWSKVTDLKEFCNEDGSTSLLITTPNVVLNVPQSAIKHIKDVPLIEPGYDLDYISAAMTIFLQNNLRPLYPAANLVIDTHLSVKCETFDPIDLVGTQPVYFRYTHGLKDSTSWGCQNIAHGHLSFIVGHYFEPEMTDQKHVRVNQYLRTIAQTIDNTVFINQSNIVQLTDTGVQIEYTTPRGTFSGIYSNNHNFVILETETTIEYIVEYVKTTFGKKLRDMGIVSLTVSEGLTKGAIVTL